jgi:hypothetical protein
MAKREAGVQKRQTKREKTALRGLDRRLFSKIKQEYHDYDYVKKLSQEEREWLSNFTTEYLGANLKEGRETGDVLHTDPDHIKDIWSQNNARNRDIYSRSKAQGIMDSYDPAEDDHVDNPEDGIIAKIDLERELEVGEPGDNSSK